MEGDAARVFGVAGERLLLDHEIPEVREVHDVHHRLELDVVSFDAQARSCQCNGMKAASSYSAFSTACSISARLARSVSTLACHQRVDLRIAVVGRVVLAGTGLGVNTSW